MGDKITLLDSIVAGSVSGMAAISVCHPLDVIRTRMQLNPSLSILQSIKSCKRGNLGLYDGFSLPFMAQAIYKSIIFGANTFSQKYLFLNSESRMLTTFGSGVFAGFINSTVVAPVEFIRTAQILTANHNLFITMGSLISRGDIISLWKGFLPTVARDGPGLGFYMLAFSQSKLALVNICDIKDGITPTWVRFVSGALAGVAFWTWAMPLDTMKTLIESSLIESSNDGRSTEIGSNIFKQSWDIIKMQMSFSRVINTLPLAYLRGIPSAAITLTVYDSTLEYLK